MKFWTLCALSVLPLLISSNVFGQWVEGGNTITFEAPDSVLNRCVVVDTVHYPHNRWQIGKPHKILFDSAYSWPNAIVTDTLFPYCPNDTSVFTIHFPWEIINSLGYPDIPMDVYFNYKIDTDVSTQVLLELWRGADSTWIPLSWTPYDLLGNWKEAMVNLPIASLSNYDTALRFVFIAGGDTSGKEGWLIDNIDVIYSWPEGISQWNNGKTFPVSPNPTHSGIVFESMYANGQIRIYNTFGSVVFLGAIGKGKQEIDLSGCAGGIYFLEVVNVDNGERMTSRLVKG